MIQMKVSDDNTVNVGGDGSFRNDIREIRESSLVIEACEFEKSLSELIKSTRIECSLDKAEFKSDLFVTLTFES